MERVNRFASNNRPQPLPKRALVEITRRCNLHCPLCPVGNGTARDIPDMQEETFQTLTGNFGAGLQSLTLHNYGEPLLHPDLPKFIRIAKKAGISWVDLTTNGTIMTRELAKQLVESGLDAIRFSVDTSDPNAYEQYRVGGKLSQVLENMACLRRARDRTGQAAPWIEAQALLMKQNEIFVDDFEPVMLAHGADAVRYKTLNVFMSGEETAEFGKTLLPSDPAYHRYACQDPMPANGREQFKACHWPWDRLVVLPDGTLVPCCHDHNADFALGKVHGGDWVTQERREFLLQRLLRPETIRICRHCAEGVAELGLRKEVDLSDQRSFGDG